MVIAEFPEEERIVIGQKLRFLMRKKEYTQAHIGEEVFHKTKKGAQSHMKRLLAGKWRSLKKKHIEDILDYIGVPWEEYEDLEVDEIEEAATQAAIAIIDGELEGKRLPKVFLKIWPDAAEFIDMYSKAKRLNNKKLMKGIEQEMINNLKERIKVLEKEVAETNDEE